MSRSLGSVGVVLAWLAAVVAATLVGVLAVGAIGSGILPEGQEPLSQAEVSRQLAAPERKTLPTNQPTPTETPTGSPTSGPSTPAPGATEALRSNGGVIYARCNPAAENGVEVTSAVPDQGYHLEQVEPEDGGSRVRFESGDTRLEVQVNCVDGRPRVVPDDDSGHDDGGHDD
ncbi:hypothetical protein [Flindersiella endophytica]